MNLVLCFRFIYIKSLNRFSNGETSHGDTEYHYIVTCSNNEIHVIIKDFLNEKTYEGFLNDLLSRYVK